MMRPWPLLILAMLVVACAGPLPQTKVGRQSFDYSYPYRAISSEEFVPQIDLAHDAASEVLQAALALGGEEA